MDGQIEKLAEYLKDCKASKTFLRIGYGKLKGNGIPFPFLESQTLYYDAYR